MTEGEPVEVGPSAGPELCVAVLVTQLHADKAEPYGGGDRGHSRDGCHDPVVGHDLDQRQPLRPGPAHIDEGLSDLDATVLSVSRRVTAQQPVTMRGQIAHDGTPRGMAAGLTMRAEVTAQPSEVDPRRRKATLAVAAMRCDTARSSSAPVSLKAQYLRRRPSTTSSPAGTTRPSATSRSTSAYSVPALSTTAWAAVERQGVRAEGCARLGSVNGEQFLRALAAQIIAEADVRHWWERFSSAFEALDLVGAVDEQTARQIGEEIRTGLADRTGENIPGFHLASRPGRRPAPRVHQANRNRDLSGLTARSAWAALPRAMGSGGVNFVSLTDQECWLVCSGAGPAPWPQQEPPRPPPGSSGGFITLPSDQSTWVSAESAMFSEIVDDQDRRYQLQFVSSGASSSGQKRQRWDLRTLLQPAPADTVKWLRFETPHGPITARLGPPAATDVSAESIVPARNAVEYYLTSQLHNHVWLYLLDPARPLARLSVIGSALVAEGSISAEHPLVAAIATVDDGIAAADAKALPPVLADALSRGPRQSAWIGTAAVGVKVSHPDGAEIGLEALVGHPDRIALHFIDPGRGRGQIGAWDFVVTATDDNGRGHVAHAEPLSSMEEGAFHFRPPLAGNAAGLTVRLEGRTAAVEVTIDLANSAGPSPSD
jgi:hypothetical protein